MADKEALYLHGVEETLLLPLWGRYTESKKPARLIKDAKCVEIVEKSGIDFSNIETHQHPLTRLAWIARAWNTDLELQKLTENDEAITVVNLGCGLDTAFFRSQSGNIHWYDLDLPSVIELRKKLLGENVNCTMIAGSVLESGSFQNIVVRGNLIVLALGLLCYFTKSEVRQVLEHIGHLASRLIMIMDYFSERGVAASNQMVLQNCSGAKMIWYANNEADLTALHPGIRLRESYPLFKKIRSLLTEQEALMAAQADQHQINSMAVLEINAK